ncbi:MAG: hypothetical protein JSW52_10290 [Candidatus Coatesbacteria bacterium]|nr:MAG: hypothetical protein JSW52_10290 [Candidatus Coatesbacteria bacterium]
MRIVTFIAVVLILTTLTACTDTVAPRVNTPAQVLEFLEESFNRGGISILDGVLSADFVFYFDQNDVGDVIDDFIIPVSWDREAHLEACGNMFGQAHSIDFEVVTDGLENPDEGTNTYEAYNVFIDLTVMVDATNGYRARGVCDFELTYNESVSNNDVGWEITNWYDKTLQPCTESLPSNIMEVSLGLILATFY